MVNTINTFNVLENNNKYEPMQYKSIWLLDSVAIRIYADMNTIVCKQKKMKHGSGIKVGIVNKFTMQQVSTGEAPFLKLPSKEKTVENFPTI